MKKTKLLTPILAVATLGSVAPIVMLTSCGNKNTGDQIELDASTSKEQVTTTNKTMTTYAFNVKKTSNANADEEEIEVEVEDVDTKDDVTVQVSGLIYDPETGKCYVTVTISKEDGTLNDEEQVSFSLNFHCHPRGSKIDKWAKKINKFIIKHSSSQIFSTHFDDTDVVKSIKKTEKGSDVAKFNFPASDVWKKSEPAEGEYDISKLKCYVLRDRDFRSWIEGAITLPEFSTAIQPSIGEDNASIDVEINYSINEFAHYGDKARFTLLFTYPEGGIENAVFQVIGGFNVHYVETLEEDHIWLAGSREQHYYLPINKENETATNSLSFILLDNNVTYTADDFTITSSDSQLTLGDKHVFTYEIEAGTTIQVLVVNYNVDQSTNFDGHLFNVALEIASKNASATWTNKIKGLSFFTIGKDWVTDTLIKSDADTLSKVEWKANAKTNLDDVLRTCYPFTFNDFVYMDSFATIDDSETTTEFNITQLGYSLISGKYSEAELDSTNVALGNHKVDFYVYVVTHNAAYSYHLTQTVEFKA